MSDDTWQQKIADYCSRYNVPLFYLSDVLSDPKVIPMIRGKAFEYSVNERLSSVLDLSKWEVDKPFMNAQSGIHDIDVRVTNKVTKQSLGIECKLSAKGTFRKKPTGYQVKVKCMRSRTLGASMVRSLAPQLNISEQQLMVHNDQYLEDNFDYVVTTLANAFYITDPETQNYIWSPTEEGKEFLIKLGAPNNDEEMKDFAFNQMYIAHSSSLTINSRNGVQCTRRNCSNKDECNFIPNYPIIEFDINGKPTNSWFAIDKVEELFTPLAG